ncbi:MAG: hypothetical protein KDC37_04900 [Flavobacteriales bacterium]|nr:hypothetical protein [Flavobacteriales bacterium]
MSAKSLYAALGILVCAQFSYGQCGRFAEKKCLPILSPYVNNGQLNTTTLFAGDSTSMVLTFYSLLEYRLLVCTHEVLEGAHFKVREIDGELLYDSRQNKNYWDFRVNATQELRIDVIVPDSDNSNGIPPSGCASIVVGFKD